MSAEDAIRSIIQRGLRPRARAMTYRIDRAFVPKVLEGAAAGATQITLGSLPAGLTGVEAGDRFGSGKYTVTAAVPAAAGVIADIAFTPALAAPIPAGGNVHLVRGTELACMGWIEWLKQTEAIAEPQRQRLANVTILADSLAVRPEAGARIIAGEDALVLKSRGGDPIGAAWVMMAVGG